MPPARITIVIPADEPAQLQGSPHLDRLRAHGEVILHADRPADDAEKVRRLRGAQVLINSRGSVKWPGEVLRQLPDLRLIASCGIGTDAIDLETCRRQGIAVCNIPGRTAGIVAEHALALMLAVARRTAFLTDQLRRGRWQPVDSVYLRGKVLGLIGAGSIAAEMARLGAAIGMRVRAWTYRSDPERAQRLGVEFVDLDELLRTADVVSLHLKLTEQSRRLIGARELALMKTGALLVNTARGGLVDTEALAAALQSGHLGGAGIDVFEVEPIGAEHPLLACAQVVLTPHCADQTPEGMELLNGGVVDNVIAFLEGRPQNRVV